jgi:formyltetrahydrofolate synthetase
MKELKQNIKELIKELEIKRDYFTLYNHEKQKITHKIDDLYNLLEVEK